MLVQAGDAELWTAWWPAIEPRLLRHVEGRSRDRVLAQDVVQDVALKLFTRRPDVEDVDAAYRWARRACETTLIDHHRRRRIEPHVVPEDASPEDVAATVEHRATLRAALAAVGELSEADRTALWSEPQAGLDRNEQVKHNMRRMRARKRLALLLAGVAGILGGLRRALVPTVSVGAALVVAAVLLLADGGRSDRAPSTVTESGELLATDLPVAQPIGAAAPVVSVSTDPANAPVVGTTGPSIGVGLGSAPSASALATPDEVNVATPAVRLSTDADPGPPEGTSTVCTDALEQPRCVDRPGPDLGGVVDLLP